MAGVPKEDFTALQKYFRLANEIQNASPVIAYYLKTYAVSKGFEYFKAAKQAGKTTPDDQKKLDEWFKDIEYLKGQIGPQDKEKNKQDYINFIYQLFLQSDNEYRDNKATVETSQMFLNCSLLFEAYALFGPVDQDVLQKKKYAKAKAIEIRKNLIANKQQMVSNPDNTNTNVANDNQQEESKDQPRFDIPYNQGNIGEAKPQNPYPDMSMGKFTTPNIPDFQASANAGANNIQQTNNLPTSSIYLTNNAPRISSVYPSYNTPMGNTNTNPNPGQTLQVGASKVRDKRKDPDYIMKIEKAKDYSKKAAGELDFRRLKQAKDNLIEALKLVEELEQQGYS